MLQIKVPATSANLCVGFDVLGLALSLYNTFTFEKSDDFEFTGFEEEFCCKENNMVYDSYKYTFEKASMPIVPVRIGFNGQIPVSRGLGSSSSLIVAGVFAANYFMQNKLKKQELFDITVELEGHPDNVAPCIYGGLCIINNGELLKFNISNKWNFGIWLMNNRVSTNEARKILQILEFPNSISSRNSKCWQYGPRFGWSGVGLRKKKSVGNAFARGVCTKTQIFFY